LGIADRVLCICFKTILIFAKNKIQMIRFCLSFVLVVIFGSWTNAQMVVSRKDGTSVETPLGYGLAVNKGSTLVRQVITVNDTLCPLQLESVTVETSYLDRNYRFKSKGSIAPVTPLSAYEIHIVLYNVFGEHLKTLSGTEVTDLVAPMSIGNELSWYGSENEVSEYFISVAYVANVRTKEGQLWHYNYDTIKDALGELKIAFEEEYLPKNNTDD
jgi:hypothetical protein